ncbi:MAG TPA: ATP-binding cassette domain-containing protein [Blastocatellia bacterium]|nr:ATP-binding cassette domain-containing protein [Blastocatellia bacterium]
MKSVARTIFDRPFQQGLPAAIEFREVSISFDDNQVLDRISFTVPRGEMRIIIGPSNSGKSTILKLAIGLLKPDSGRIFIDDVEITGRPESELLELRQRVGVVFQTDALFSMSVAENVAYRLIQQGKTLKEIEDEVRRVLAVVGLEQAYDLMPNELSGGMSRRTAIARALVGSPQMMFYDSPCAGLDPIMSRKIMRAIMRLRDFHHVTSLYVTQTLDEVRFLCSRFYETHENGETVLRKEQNDYCLINTRILMLADRQIIFDGSDELFWEAAEKDEKIKHYLA